MERYNFNKELSGKIALVTGGTKGVGKAIADRLLNAGATVIITARNEPEEENEKLHFIQADLSKVAGTNKVVDEVLSTYKKLDILVNNLGSSETKGGGFSVLTDEDWELGIQTNLLAPVRLDRQRKVSWMHWVEYLMEDRHFQKKLLNWLVFLYLQELII
ncbi:short chain dehydrogenase [Chryseobacterium joostei]|uniref:Short chain dehydrogenase n=1 Tax=Chryseobacterium joostei TaxID=112234 RepID=A0A1N7I1I9_9FLAO|nr:short chain dehydrogenase [Chryseobacterium joostei]SIS47333.1 short chain dehydrogenase [Chryseobacterium joostei]